MSEETIIEIAKLGEDAWAANLEAKQEDKSLISELPGANFMARNYSNYHERFMILPEVDMGDFLVDRNGTRYFQSTNTAYKGYVCKFFDDILKKLRKFSYVLGNLGGEKVELLGQVKEVFTWWNSYVFIDTVGLRIPGKVTVFFENDEAKFVGESILDEKVAELREAGDDLPEGLTEIPADIDPLTLAKLFYHLCVKEDNYDLWLQTLSKGCMHGANPLPRVKSWWGSMKKDRTYYYVKTAIDEENKKKYFFQRMVGGEDTGSPGPMTLVKQDGQWKVDGASP